MAYDSIEKIVSELKDKKAELEAESKEFQRDFEKVRELSELAKISDLDAAEDIEDVRRSFEKEHQDLLEREEELLHDKEEVVEQISEEKKKTEAARDRLHELVGKKYSSGVAAAEQKGEELLAKLKRLLTDIGETGTGNAGSAMAGFHGSGIGKANDVSHQGLSAMSKPAPGTGKAVPGGGPKFGNFDLAKREGSSDYFVQGMHYQQFIRDYYNYNPSAYEDLNKNPVMATIAPGDIEGISLGKNEAEDSARFWGQHERGGTMESFVAIAKNIPEVQMLIDGGFTLDQIRQDSRLSQCVDLYFDPAKMTRVIQCGNYYEFCDNGRHRVLAAREAGHKIPVKIVGRRKW